MEDLERLQNIRIQILENAIRKYHEKISELEFEKNTLMKSEGLIKSEIKTKNQPIW